MTNPDLNLLLTLDAVLSEGSVARAAQRLHLSPSAMSRALARLREATGDPLLVRAGRALVPTPRAAELREQVGALVHTAQAMLRPADALDLRTLSRTFTLRVREGFLDNVGVALVARAAQEAPGVRLCFIQKDDKQSTALRDGRVDLDTGVVGRESGPEVRTRALFRDRFVGVVRPGHPLCAGALTPQRYAGASHIGVSRRGVPGGPVDDALLPLGLTRPVATIVASFSGALALAAGSDLVATVPERQTGKLRAGLHSFVLPFAMPELTVSLLWHPRMDADQAHRWLRGLVLDVCAAPATHALASADF